MPKIPSRAARPAMRSPAFFSGIGAPGALPEAGADFPGGGAPPSAFASSSPSAAARGAMGGGGAPAAGAGSSRTSSPRNVAFRPREETRTSRSPRRNRTRSGVAGRRGGAAKSPVVSTATEPSGSRTVHSAPPPRSPRSGARSVAAPEEASSSSS